MPVDAVQRHQVGVAGAPDQPRQQGLLDVGAGRHHRQEMRLVGDQNVFIDMQDGFLEWNRRLSRHLSEIVHAQANPIGVIDAYRLALGVQHPTASHALQPDIPGNRRKVCTQAVEHARPVTGRQVQGARA